MSINNLFLNPSAGFQKIATSTWDNIVQGGGGSGQPTIIDSTDDSLSINQSNQYFPIVNVNSAIYQVKNINTTTNNLVNNSGIIDVSSNLLNLNSIDVSNLNASTCVIGGNLFPNYPSTGYLYADSGNVTYQTPSTGQPTIIDSTDDSLSINQSNQYFPIVNVNSAIYQVKNINTTTNNLINSSGIVDISNNLITKINNSVQDISNNDGFIDVSGTSDDKYINLSSTFQNTYAVKNINTTTNNLINSSGVVDISNNLITKINNSVQDISNNDGFIDVSGTTDRTINLSTLFSSTYNVKQLTEGSNITFNVVDGNYTINASSSPVSGTIYGTTNEIKVDPSGADYILSLYPNIDISGTLTTLKNTTNDGIGNDVFGNNVPIGNYNIGIGENCAVSLANSTSASNNIIIGANACTNGTDTSQQYNGNVIIGTAACQNILNGSNSNVILGLSAGVSLSGLNTNNILIGANSDLDNSADSNSVVIGSDFISKFKIGGIGIRQIFSYKSTTTSFSFYNAGGTSSGSIIKTYDQATLINTFNEFAIYLSTSTPGFSNGNFEQGVNTSYLISDSLNSKFDNFDVIGTTANWQSTQINSYIPCLANSLIICCASIIKSGSNYYVKILPVDSNVLFPLFAPVFKLNNGIDSNGGSASNTQYSSWCLGRWFSNF